MTGKTLALLCALFCLLFFAGCGDAVQDSDFNQTGDGDGEHLITDDGDGDGDGSSTREDNRYDFWGELDLNVVNDLSGDQDLGDTEPEEVCSVDEAPARTDLDGNLCEEEMVPGDEFQALNCPRSQGFWRNHSEAWPGQLDSCGFTLCGFSYMEILTNQTGAGDAWQALARHFVATTLSELAGAELPCDVLEGLYEAGDLLSACSIAPNDEDQAASLQELFDSYNASYTELTICD